MNIEGIHANTYSTQDDNDNNEVLSNGDGYDDCDVEVEIMKRGQRRSGLRSPVNILAGLRENSNIQI